MFDNFLSDDFTRKKIRALLCYLEKISKCQYWLKWFHFIIVLLINDEILMNEKIMQKLEHFFSCFYNILLTIGLNIGCFVLFYNKKII